MKFFRFTAVVVAVGVFLALPQFVDAQVHTLTASDGSGFQGGSVSSTITLDNPEEVRGFSMGLTHDSLVLTLTLISQGPALTSSNGGDGPDFWQPEINPINGPGGTCGAVLSFAVPLDSIPIGSNDLGLYNYTIVGAANSSSTLAFSDALGNPPLQTVVSVAGVTRIPTTVSGTVSVGTASVSGLTCTLNDGCSCEYSMSWTNGEAYDSIQVRQDGVLVATLAGTATSHLLNLIATGNGGPATSTLSVTGVHNTVSSTAVSCSADCPEIAGPFSPTGLSCSVNTGTGLVSISWTNAQTYASLSLSLDGVPTGSLAARATSTSLTLSTPGSYLICIDGTDACGSAFTQVCCTVTFEQVFVRLDCNADGSVNISDPIYNLEFLFNSGPSVCFDAMDSNDDSSVNLADVIHGLNAIFGLGPVPSAPYPDCGTDPSADALGCDSFPSC